MASLSTSKTRAPRYDVIVVGSGAAGGMAAYALTHAGAKVLMLEAGRDYDATKETPMFQSFAEAPLRGIPTPEKPRGFFHANIGGWTVPDEPYLVRREGQPGWHEGKTENREETAQKFMWWRARMLGGRTNHWGRMALRMSERDFKPASHDGLGVDWPIGYTDLAEYYDKVDQLIGVFGSREGDHENPDSDFFQPAPAPRAYELLLKRAGTQNGLKIIPSRMAVLTRPIHGRSACFYATPCSRGCSIRATFQSTTALIPPALATGNLDVLTGAMTREIIVGNDGEAKGVVFIDKSTGREERVEAHAVVLGASACETARILMNSRSARSPQGLGNSSGHLGRWLTDSVGSGISARLPMLENLPPHNEDGVSFSHLYAPWTRERGMVAAKEGVPRGYYLAWGGGRTMPDFGTVRSLLSLSGDAHGSALKSSIRRYYGSVISLYGRGEMIPNAESYCELDPEKKDRWGIPVLRFNFRWSEHEIRQAVHMRKTMRDLVVAAGGSVLGGSAENDTPTMTTGGSVNHELGVTRMSSKPADGVTAHDGRLWDCPNVVVADGGVFASNPYKNPTLTILAHAWRATDHLLRRAKENAV